MLESAASTTRCSTCRPWPGIAWARYLPVVLLFLVRMSPALAWQRVGRWTGEWRWTLHRMRMRVLAECRAGSIPAAASVSTAGASTFKHEPGRGTGESTVLVWDLSRRPDVGWPEIGTRHVDRTRGLHSPAWSWPGGRPFAPPLCCELSSRRLAPC